MPRLNEIVMDAERFRWWFSSVDKSAFVSEYLCGVREGWSLNEWRIALDSAMQAEEHGDDTR
jgi:hypothetical protein